MTSHSDPFKYSTRSGIREIVERNNSPDGTYIDMVYAKISIRDRARAYGCSRTTARAGILSAYKSEKANEKRIIDFYLMDAESKMKCKNFRFSPTSEPHLHPIVCFLNHLVPPSTHAITEENKMTTKKTARIFEKSE